MEKRNKILFREWSSKNKKAWSEHKKSFVGTWEHECECGRKHTWNSSISSRLNGKGCSICAKSAKVCECKSLEKLRPDIAAQWHPTKNKIKPNEVPVGSNKKIWWICFKSKCHHPHEWETSINNFVNSNRGCPWCIGMKKFCSCKSLKVLNPELSLQWHPTKNKIKPSQVKPHSNVKVWWLCKKSECEHRHEWQSTVSNRTKGRGCPWCIHHKICICNSLSVLRPELTKEWNFNKNKIKPTEVSEHSAKKVWWICSRGHEWLSSVSNRSSHGKGCPECRMSKSEKIIDEILKQKGVKSIYQKGIFFKDKQLYFDFYLPDRNCVIEFDGIQHFEPVTFFGGKKMFKKQKLHDLYKNIYCVENQVKLLRIHYSDTAEIESMINFLINPPTVLPFRLYTTSYPKF